MGGLKKNVFSLMGPGDDFDWGGVVIMEYSERRRFWIYWWKKGV